MEPENLVRDLGVAIDVATTAFQGCLDYYSATPECALDHADPLVEMSSEVFKQIRLADYFAPEGGRPSPEDLVRARLMKDLFKKLLREHRYGSRPNER